MKYMFIACLLASSWQVVSAEQPKWREFLCKARNAHGQLFTATDRDRDWAQEEAVRRCQEVSAVCYATGCVMTKE
jgi:hypothetical protein